MLVRICRNFLIIVVSTKFFLGRDGALILPRVMAEVTESEEGRPPRCSVVGVAFVTKFSHLVDIFCQLASLKNG